MQFSCERCGDNFTCKRNLIGHLSRQKDCMPTNTTAPSRLELLTKVTTKHINDINFPCKHCEERFNTKSAMYKHMRKCTTKNLQQVVATTTHPLSNISILALKEQLKKEIMNELQQSIQTSPQTIINNTTNNITIQAVTNNFGEENTEHLSGDLLSYCILNPRKGMSKLIETIHYNENVPENHNIRCKSLKQNIFEKYIDSEWRACDASNTLDELIRKGYRILNTHYTDNILTDPTIFDDEHRMKAYEKFRFLSDKTCLDYHAVKREVRLLVKDRTFYLLASPDVHTTEVNQPSG
jgi:hypothetical protein